MTERPPGDDPLLALLDAVGRTALRELRPDWRITLISGESTYHYSRPALMYVYMGHMRYEDTKPFPDALWKEKRIDLVRAWVTGIDTAAKRLALHEGGPIEYDRLLVATGSVSNKFGWPGQDLDGVQGLWGLMDLKRLYETTKRAKSAVIVGGGLIGIELGEMLHSRGIHVTFLVRERSYWSNILPAEESAMVNREIERHGLDAELLHTLPILRIAEAGDAPDLVVLDELASDGKRDLTCRATEEDLLPAELAHANSCGVV